MSKISINDAYKGVNGAEQLYYIEKFPKLKYTNNVRDIVIENCIQHILLPIIATRFKRIPDDFQIWNFQRLYEGDKPTKNFMLTCHIESDYLHKIEAENVQILQYAECLYDLDVNFDILDLWLENDTLLLPQER